MLTDKEQKNKFKSIASESFEKFYPVTFLKKEGFSRGHCSKCGTYFWSVIRAEVCGDGLCGDGFTFMNKKIAKNKLTYLQVWKKFSGMFGKLGYKYVKRYPVVARWNPTMDFTIASIAAFQPYVVSGEVEPPAKKLVIPQFCLRFGDVDSVGLTGAHNSGFVMIGQHVFVDNNEWNQEKCFEELYKWFLDGIGLEKEDLTLHEDAWAGGGNFGPCMEFFSGGLELANQVYMMYEQTERGDRGLTLKVLDMGMGHERVAWFTLGTVNSYEATFPRVIKKLKKVTSVKSDNELVKKFMPYAGNLNMDEIEDAEKQWNFISEKIGVPKHELKEKILPLQGLYSVAEHSRALLVALTDGALPSNTGGEYNLRVLIRRALGFIHKFKWNVSLGDVCKWHTEELEVLWPELKENLDSVREILRIEEEKYKQTKEKSKAVINKLLQGHVTTAKLVEIYDSHGIPPDLVVELASTQGKKVRIPDNFYALVSERHHNKKQTHQYKRELIKEFEFLNTTKVLYLGDYLKDLEFSAQVIGVKDNYAVLDKTCFYPTSGGQIHDTGFLDEFEVLDVFKQGDKIVHQINGVLIEGQRVHGSVDKNHRAQLAVHHTSTHVINTACRKVLGKHVNQAGAKKTFDNAHIDITHYQRLSDPEMKEIEKVANSVVMKGLKVHKGFMLRGKAERKYGMDIYQGGAVPGKNLRIVNIDGWDVEACGGTHLNYTKEIGSIKLLRSSKISDSVVRIEFVAGVQADKFEKRKKEIIYEIKSLLNNYSDEPCREEDIVAKGVQVFGYWKKVVKKKKPITQKFELNNKGDLDLNKIDVLFELARELNTQPEHVLKTLHRMIREIEEKQQ